MGACRRQREHLDLSGQTGKESRADTDVDKPVEGKQEVFAVFVSVDAHMSVTSLDTVGEEAHVRNLESG